MVAAVAPRGPSRSGRLRAGAIQMEMPAASMSDSRAPAKLAQTCMHMLGLDCGCNTISLIH